METTKENSNIESVHRINLKQKQVETHIKKKEIRVTYTSTNEISLKKAMENLIKIKAEKNCEKS